MQQHTSRELGDTADALLRAYNHFAMADDTLRHTKRQRHSCKHPASTATNGSTTPTMVLPGIRTSEQLERNNLSDPNGSERL